MLVQKVAISCEVPGSCPPKSFEGKPSTAKPFGEYLACSFCSPSYCGVWPHLEAVLTTSTTLPAHADKGVGVPSSRVMVKPWMELPAAGAAAAGAAAAGSAAAAGAAAGWAAAAGAAAGLTLAAPLWLGAASSWALQPAKAVKPLAASNRGARGSRERAQTPRAKARREVVMTAKSCASVEG